MHTTILTWTELPGQFFRMFTQPGGHVFSTLMTGWVLCTARRTTTGMLPFADALNLHVSGLADVPYWPSFVVKRKF